MRGNFLRLKANLEVIKFSFDRGLGLSHQWVAIDWIDLGLNYYLEVMVPSWSTIVRWLVFSKLDNSRRKESARMGLKGIQSPKILFLSMEKLKRWEMMVDIFQCKILNMSRKIWKYTLLKTEGVYSINWRPISKFFNTSTSSLSV
jgi:hypothetical protein